VTAWPRRRTAESPHSRSRGQTTSTLMKENALEGVDGWGCVAMARTPNQKEWRSFGFASEIAEKFWVSWLSLQTNDGKRTEFPIMRNTTKY
jgi:hypothetical protein